MMTDVITIKKYDEVYNKLICDPGIMMEISDYFTFDVPGAKFTPAYKSKFWDGKIRLVNIMSGLLYAGLKDQVELFCKNREYEFQQEGDFGDQEFSVNEANSFIEKLKPKHLPRDYQFDAFLHAVRKKRAVLLSPTGSGKSLIIYLLCCWYRKKTLIIVPTTSLVHQMSSDFVDYGLPEKGYIHKIMSGEEKASDCLFTVSTWQSIYKMPKSWFDQFDVVIGDEAHTFKAKSLTSIMTKLTDCEYRFAFTGTLDGTLTNKLVLEGLFGTVRKVATSSELMEKKQLSDLIIKAIVLQYPEDIKKTFCKVDYQVEMDYIVQNLKRNNFIKNLALSLEGNTLLLFQYVEKQGKVIHDLISKDSVERKTFLIHGSVDGEKRDEIRKILKDETNAILTASYGTTQAGINIPNLSNLIFCSPSKSVVRNLQSIGRVLRTAEDKKFATLYDIADDLSWKSKKNHTLGHFVERIKIYNNEQFNYKIYNVTL